MIHGLKIKAGDKLQSVLLIACCHLLLALFLMRLLGGILPGGSLQCCLKHIGQFLTGGVAQRNNTAV